MTGWGNVWHQPATQRDVILYYDDVQVKVNATVIGDLAVHSHLELWGKLQVSHVPTATSFMKAVPVGTHSVDKLINWCKLVQQHCRDEWNMLAKLTFENYDDPETIDADMEMAKHRVQQMCRNTPL